VREPFAVGAHIDEAELADLVATAVRFMDDVIDISRFPLPEQEHEAKTKRRIGLGVTGLADALIQCGARYGSARAVQLTEQWMRVLQRAAYLASVELAKEKGAFALFDKDKYLAGETVSAMDEDVRDAIAEHGIRNALLTSVAPTGTISLFADNVSSGLEPVFSFSYTRSVLMPDGTRREEEVSDHAYRVYRKMFGETAPLTDAFVDAQRLAPKDHLVMQAAMQKYVDSSISKTINVPESISFEDFKTIYEEAYEIGCKGCTTYRPNEITGAVLKPKKAADENQPELPLEAPSAKAAKPSAGDMGATVVQMTQPLARPGALEGKTYKIQWPESDHAMYITINDVIDDNGRIRPFEVFINTKSVEHYAWMVALTRMISAVFRRGGDITFVVEELKAVFDPRGGHWMGGKYVPSLLAAIGDVIDQHLHVIGFLKEPETITPEADAGERPKVVAMAGGGEETPSEAAAPKAGAHAHGLFRSCPKCSQPSLIRQEGCDTCTSCGYSKCG
jgi:ribonucleoside-diphosphate reductase alpha chain